MPVLPTIVVALAVAAMIGLGLWQLLQRLPEKEDHLRQLAANPTKSAIPFPATPDNTLLFRRATAMCVEPVAIRKVGAGKAGFRLIADCRTGVQGSGMPVQLGTTRDPNASVAWGGGPVTGYLSHAPDSRPLIAGLFDSRARPLMLVADTPPPGLTANARPDLSAVPNNHLAYAVQWFFFAGAAAVIYALALRRRV